MIRGDIDMNKQEDENIPLTSEMIDGSKNVLDKTEAGELIELTPDMLTDKGTFDDLECVQDVQGSNVFANSAETNSNYILNNKHCVKISTNDVRLGTEIN